MPTPDRLWYADVEYTFTGILENPNVSYEKKMEARVGYREKGNTKRFYECRNDIYVKDDGHMAVKHTFSSEFAGKDMEVVFYFNTPDNGIVIAIKLEPAYLLESTYIHDHLQSIASEITEGISEEETHSIHPLYTAIADGSIPNPTIRVERTPSINTVAKYDKSTQEIIVNDALLYRIQDDDEQKYELFQALAKTYSEYIVHKAKTTIDASSASFGAVAMQFDGIDADTITFATLTSPKYTGDLLLQLHSNTPEDGLDLASTEDEPNMISSNDISSIDVSDTLMIKFEHDKDHSFKVHTGMMSTGTVTQVNALQLFVIEDTATKTETYELRYRNHNMNHWITTDPTSNAQPDDWVYDIETGTYTWEENVTSAEDADLQGKEYIGVNLSDVEAHFTANNNLFERYLGSKKGGYLRYTDVDSYYDTKIPIAIEDMFKKHKWYYNLKKNKDSRAENGHYSKIVQHKEMRRVLKRHVQEVKGVITIDGVECCYTAYLGGADNTSLNIMGFHDIHPQKDWTLGIMHGGAIQDNLFYLSNSSVGASYPVISIYFEDQGTYEYVVDWFLKYKKN